MTGKLADGMAYPPRMLRLERAAAYLSMSVSAFQRGVEDGTLPAPSRYKGNVAWDRFKLDAWADALDADSDAVNTVHAILKGKS